MKFSKTYLLYPDNKALELAISNAIEMMSEDLAASAVLDTMGTTPDNFLQTRGDFEQQRFSSNILESARDVLEQSLTNESRDQEPLAWAEIQNNIGNVLAASAQQMQDEALYEKAIQSFSSALEVLDQETSAMQWAATQYNLGTASQALGRQLGDAKLLKQATDAYTDALLVWTKDKMPMEWGATMHRLGASLHAHGKLLKGNRTLQKAVVAYKNALAVFDADLTALELVATHNNRGAVLQHLGQSEENADRLEEAVRSYETALTVSMEQQLPIHLAVLCKTNKATARMLLAELTQDAALADEVADDFELIMECFPHALQPLCSMHCEEQMKNARLLVASLSGKAGTEAA